jgi:hypothetical protein
MGFGNGKLFIFGKKMDKTLNFKIIFLLAFLFLSEFVLAQNFNDFDKVIFEYYYGSETTIEGYYVENEIFKLIKNNEGNYILNKDEIIKKYYYKKNDEILFKNSKNITFVDSTKIAQLYYELNKNKDNFNSKFIKSKLSPIKKSFIKKFYRERKIVRKFEHKIISKKKRKLMFKDIINLKKFDEFIEFKKPKYNSIYGMLHARKNTKILFIQDKDTITFEPEVLNSGQPIKRFEDVNNKIVNLNVNLLIENILPENSKFRNNLKLDTFTYKYVIWYIDNQIDDYID